MGSACIDDFGYNHRLFDPKGPTYGNLSTAKLSDYDENKTAWHGLPFTTLERPNELITMTETMVVAIYGACQGNGTPAARAAYGICFGPDSPFNRQGCLEGTTQTNQAAEIEAAMRALDLVLRMTKKNLSISNVVLMTSSSPLVRSITEFIWTWLENGWWGPRGQRVGNREAFGSLHTIIEYMKDDGIDVQFWLIPRNENEEAERLANFALGVTHHSTPLARLFAPTTIPQMKISPAWDYWNYTAQTLPEARALAQRLKLEFPTSDKLDIHRALRYPIRRLVTTGEIRQRTSASLWDRNGRTSLRTNGRDTNTGF